MIINKAHFQEKFGLEPYVPQQDGLLYKYFSYPRALQAVTESALYFASPNQLNDSFELDLDRIKFEMNDENVHQLLARYFPNQPEKQKEIFEKSKVNRQFVPEALKSELEKFKNKAGICCFTTDPRNRLMWGHYGMSDTGVCIGFDLPPYNPIEPELFIMKVIYEQERNFINYFERPMDIFQSWAFVKNSDWAHEKEFRAINMAHSGLMSFNLACIKEIHYGMKTKLEDIGKMEAFLTLKDFGSHQKFKIQASKISYGLESVSF